MLSVALGFLSLIPRAVCPSHWAMSHDRKSLQEDVKTQMEEKRQQKLVRSHMLCCGTHTGQALTLLCGRLSILAERGGGDPAPGEGVDPEHGPEG